MSATMTQTDIEDSQFLGKQPQPRAATGAIVVQNKPFAEALARAASIAGRSDIPIVSCVLLCSDGHLLAIEANNLELAIRQTIAVSGGSGEGCINAAMLNAIMQRLPQGAETALEFRGDRMVWKCGTSRGTLEALSAAEFPTFAEGNFDCRFTMPKAELAVMLERTRPFVSNEKTRHYLGGVYLAIVMVDGEARLRATATNGNELGFSWIAIPEGAKGMPNIILPTATITEIAKIVDGAGVIEIGVSETRFLLRSGDLTIASKVIDGTYPDADRVVPRSNPNVLTVGKSDLMHALNLATIVSEGATPFVRVAVSADAATISGGDGTGTIVCELPRESFTYSGDDMSMAYWTKSLLEITKLTGKSVEFRFANETPLRAVDPDDGSALYVAMSIRR